MDAATLRQTIRDRLDGLGITPHHAARLAGLPDQTVRDYLHGTSDPSTDRVLRLAAALGLAIQVRPVKGFEPAAPAPAGRPKK